MVHRARPAFALLAVLALAGCIEDKQTVTLEPDGKGTLRVERILGKQMSEMMLSMVPGGDKLQAVRGVAAQQLAQLDGVVAWSDVEATVTDDQRIRIVGTGWFDDVSRLGTDRDGKKTPMFLVDRQGDAVTLRIRQDQAGGDDDKSYFDREPAEIEMMKGMLKGMVEGPLEGLSVDVVLSLPGAAAEASGWTTQEAGDRARVGYHLDAARVVQMLEQMLTIGEELRPKVAAGELTKEAGDAELKRRLASTAEARVRFTPVAARATPDFAARYQAAVGAWADSPWRAEVEKARAGGGALTFGGPPAEPPPEGLTRSTPDGLEPNDSADAATPVPEATTLKDLLLEEGGEDWFKVAIPQGKELTVTARFDGSKGDIELEVLDPEELRSLRTSASSGNVERATIAAAKAPRTVLVRLYNGRNPYHLEVALADWVAVDAFEPNDGKDEAAALTAGTHEGLVCNGEDWYRLEAPAGKLLDVTVAFEASQGDLELSLEAASGLPLGESRGMAAEERVRCFAPEEPVLLRVFNATGVKYSMKVVVADAPPPDALEPNDGPSQAKPLPAGSTAGLMLEGEDWFRLDVPAGKQLRIVARKTDEALPGDVDLTLFAPGAEAGEVIELTTSRGGFDGKTTLMVVRPKPGPVLVRASGPIVPYALEVQAEAYTPADAYEPNEYRVDARPITPGTLEGLVCTGDDWYRVELPAGQRLTVTIRFKNADADLDLDLQDVEGMYLGSSAGTDDQEVVTLEPDEAARSVCIHIASTDREKRANYVLEVKVEK